MDCLRFHAVVPDGFCGKSGGCQGCPNCPPRPKPQRFKPHTWCASWRGGVRTLCDSDSDFMGNARKHDKAFQPGG